jgi:nucleoside-diphosphate-sugar epimerase
MRVLITGAATLLGRAVASGLGSEHQLRLTGPAGSGVTAADLRSPGDCESLVAGIDAIVHLTPYSPERSTDVATEKQVLDDAGRGTYVLMHAALQAGVRRVVLASRLELLEPHPCEALVDETWRALPQTTAAGLAPYMAELTLREFVRAENLLGICLRFGDLDSPPDGTSTTDAVSAIRRALAMDPAGRKHRWWLYHISSGGRFGIEAAKKEPLLWAREEVA